MNKKKGFTLIELLAVIVILAIIALIATPLVMNIINDAKKGAFEDSSYAIINAAEQGYAKGLIKELETSITEYEYANGEKTLKQGNVEVNYKGSSPESGTLLINEEGEVAIAFYSNGWCITKSYAETKITTTSKAKIECVITEEVPSTGYKENNLKGSDPVINEGMIPIVYDEVEARWEKADTNSKWYDYETQMWANVALVTTASRSGYQSVASGTEVKEVDILAYLVWIPKYEYETITSETATEIKVNFISKDTTTPTSNYIIHPAFTFGEDKLSGIWVGKFETSTETSSACYTSQSEANCNITTLNPRIKPNVSSLRYQNVSTQFTTIQKLKSSTYGLTTGDAHMMKNTEWGAVAYLSQSKYGKYGNSMYTGANKEIYQNKDSGFITGKSNGTPSISTINTQCVYNDITNRGNGTGACGAGASTTGNIYGIYDMSGGAYEYVMGAMYNNNNNTTIMVGLSGFNQTTIDSNEFAKYIDKYAYGTTYNDTAAYNRALTGDATKETKGWYSGSANFVYSSYSWFLRGSYSYNDNAGQFSFIRYGGDAIVHCAARAVYVNP